MSKFNVRMEFDTESIDFGDILIEAPTRELAIAKAVQLYLTNEVQIDYYASDTMDSTLRDNYTDWDVEEVDYD